MAKLPLSFSKALRAWKEVSTNAEQTASIVLAGEPELVALAQEKFSVGGTVPATWAGPLTNLSDMTGTSGEIVVVVVGADKEAAVLTALQQATPKGGVVVAVREASGAAGGSFSHPFRNCIRLAFSDSPAGWHKVFAACAQLAGDRITGLGKRYPVLRQAAAQRIIQRTAAQNALIGLVFVVPGADMPAMTLNQIKMLLYLAPIYGAEISKDRALELLAILAVGFGLRGVARKIVSYIPGFGWIYKGIIAYTGTVAVGYAAIKYFERDAPASTDRVLALVNSLKS